MTHERTDSMGRRRMMLGGVAAFAFSSRTYAQQEGGYPTRPIRLIVPVPPGGVADQAARALSERLRVELGQSIVVDNRPGAAGTLGTAQVRQAPADGYTLLLSLPSAQITAPLLMERPPFDGVKDFTAIGRFARFTAVLLVNESVPARSFPSFLAYVKQRPGKLNYGSTGIGSNPHLVAELLKMRTGMQLVHIPYKGGAPALQALVSDEVQVLFGELSTALPWIRSGRVRPLVVVSEKRSTLLPDVPTLTEVGVADAPTDSWMGLAGPQGLPTIVVQRLHQTLVKAVQHPDMQQFFAKGGVRLRRAARTNSGRCGWPTSVAGVRWCGSTTYARSDCPSRRLLPTPPGSLRETSAVWWARPFNNIDTSRTVSETLSRWVTHTTTLETDHGWKE